MRGERTTSGHHGLDFEEPLLFEQGAKGRSGVDLPTPNAKKNRLGGLERKAEIGLPGLSEPQVIRHFTRLSQKNFSIDTGFYPLGSCTMKHNPRLNEKTARLAGFASLHPLQPFATVQGALKVIDRVAAWLKVLTGLHAIAMSPAAGAQGELCGMMTIRAALAERGDVRARVLVPESAHGTNPATAASLGYRVDPVPGDARGRMDLHAFRSKLGPDVAAVMLTNPNTCGLFENEILEVARAIHDAGGFLYADGANFNAIVGRVRPVDLGIDCMHINLHKTFSTPHGGGGPGAGPVALSEDLSAFAPYPFLVHDDDGLRLIEGERDAPADTKAFGRLKGFHGQMGMFIRALTYMLSHGGDGLRQVAEDAVLNANYLLASLKNELSAPYPGPCMHEALFDDAVFRAHGITTLDFAKALIDEGFHPMTIYFPLVVHGALLMEPTECESKEGLDHFIATVKALVARLKAGQVTHFQEAPRFAPRRRLDETQAARHPVLRWRPGA